MTEEGEGRSSSVIGQIQLAPPVIQTLASQIEGLDIFGITRFTFKLI